MKYCRRQLRYVRSKLLFVVRWVVRLALGVCDNPDWRLARRDDQIAWTQLPASSLFGFAIHRDGGAREIIPRFAAGADEPCHL